MNDAPDREWRHDDYDGECRRETGTLLLVVTRSELNGDFVWGVHSGETLAYGGCATLEEARGAADAKARELLTASLAVLGPAS